MSNAPCNALLTHDVTLLVTPAPTRPDPTRPIKPSNSRSEHCSRLLIIPPRRCHSLQTADQARQGDK